MEILPAGSGAAADGLRPSEAAAALRDALEQPLTLEWEVRLESGCRATLSAQLTRGKSAWPPDRVALRIASPSQSSSSLEALEVIEIRVTSSASVEHLAELLQAAETLACGQGKPEPCAPEQDVRLVAEDADRGIKQPLCLQQWHHDVCGYHALFNARCLLLKKPQELLDQELFWRETLAAVTLLARHGEESSRWARSRVTGGTVDSVHLEHLIGSRPELPGHITVLISPEELASRLGDPSSSCSQALKDIRAGSAQGHAFLLGAVTHWYAAVISPSLCEGSGPRNWDFWFCDSYNTPSILPVFSTGDMNAIASQQVEALRPYTYKSLRHHPEWRDRPEEHLERAFIEGVEEWWKGVQRSSAFWKYKPREVMLELKRLELQELRQYVEILLNVMAEHCEPKGSQCCCS